MHTDPASLTEFLIYENFATFHSGLPRRLNPDIVELGPPPSEGALTLILYTTFLLTNKLQLSSREGIYSTLDSCEEKA